MKNKKRTSTYRIIAIIFALIMVVFISGCGQELFKMAEQGNNITNDSESISLAPTTTPEATAATPETPTETLKEPTTAPEEPTITPEVATATPEVTAAASEESASTPEPEVAAEEEPFEVNTYTIKTQILLEPTAAPEQFSFGSYNLILNNNSHLFHQNYCESVYEISPENREGYNGTAEQAMAAGYAPCAICSSAWIVTPEPVVVTAGATYVLNTNTYKFHYPSCGSVNQMADKNKWIFTGSREEIIGMGYVPCKKCNP